MPPAANDCCGRHDFGTLGMSNPTLLTSQQLPKTAFTILLKIGVKAFHFLPHLLRSLYITHLVEKHSLAFITICIVGHLHYGRVNGLKGIFILLTFGVNFSWPLTGKAQYST